MIQENDLGYYRRREAAARELALRCSDAAIKRIHSEMADQYAAKVRQLVARSPLRLASVTAP